MRDDSVLISIVIVGYNAGESLSLCLDSIYRQAYRNFEVIFVNNASGDNTSLILNSYPDIKVINNENNMGFCFANNQGIKVTRGDFILTLNSDIILDKDFLEEMRKAIEGNDVALLGAKILNNNGKAIDSTGLLLSRFYRFFDRGSGEIDRGQYDKKLDIFGPCAAAALYNKNMLEDIKCKGEYFDEDFFFLGEDFDLAWRAKNKGWKAKFVPGAICYHIRNSTNFNDKFRQYLSLRNRYFLLIKNSKVSIKHIFIFLLYDLPRLVYMLCINRYALKALSDMIKFTPCMLDKRRQNQVRRQK